MAIREQKGRQRPFFVYWINPFTGKRESKSCETKEEAEKLDAFVKYQLKYERESFRREDVENVSHVHTLETIFYLYLKDRNFKVDNLEIMLVATKSIISNYGDIEIEKVDAHMLEKMQNYIRASGIKDTTVRRRMGIIRAVLQWAFRHGYIKVLLLFPPLPVAKYARYVPPTQEEIALIYRCAAEHVKRALILGFYFGLRVGKSEMMRLTWADVDIEQRVIRVPNADKGVTEPWRDVPIREDLIPLIKEWYKQDIERGQTYIVAYKGKPIRSFKTAWRTALQCAGITRHIRPYDLRHGFATEAIAAGVDYGRVAALMGHKSPTMIIEHYQHVKTKQKIEAVEAIPSPPQCVQTDVCKN